MILSLFVLQKICPLRKFFPLCGSQTVSFTCKIPSNHAQLTAVIERDVVLFWLHGGLLEYAGISVAVSYCVLHFVTIVANL
jgi:hypothetical protein